MKQKISIYQLASALGVNINTIRNRMKKAGIKVGKVKTVSGRSANGIALADISKIRRY